MKGVTVKIDDSGDGEGEVLFTGRNTFMGYIWDEARTREAFTSDFSWSRTGDIGRFNAEGFLNITGRVKELLVTSGGENIAPVLVEDNIKSELKSVVNNAMVVGDGRKYLTVLLTLRVEVDPTTMQPTERLDGRVIRWCAKLGVNGLHTVDDFRTHEAREVLYRALREGVDRANARAISNPHRVQDFTVLPAEFSVAGGELGPTLKLRRFYVVEKYADVIQAMYDKNAGSADT